MSNKGNPNQEPPPLSDGAPIASERASVLREESAKGKSLSARSELSCVVSAMGVDGGVGDTRVGIGSGDGGGWAGGCSGAGGGDGFGVA